MGLSNSVKLKYFYLKNHEKILAQQKIAFDIYRGDRLFTHFVEPSGLCPILYYNKNSFFERGT